MKGATTIKGFTYTKNIDVFVFDTSNSPESLFIGDIVSLEKQVEGKSVQNLKYIEKGNVDIFDVTGWEYLANYSSLTDQSGRINPLERKDVIFYALFFEFQGNTWKVSMFSDQAIKINAQKDYEHAIRTLVIEK